MGFLEFVDGILRPFRLVGEFMSHLFKKTFPPANELTVFVFTVTILSMFIYMDGWFDGAVLMISEVIENIFRLTRESTGFKDSAKAYGALIFLPILFGVLVFGPLLMPFNKKDLRGLSVTMIFIHASIFVYANITLAKEYPSFVNTLIVLYSIAWVIYIWVVGDKFKQDQLMSDQQAKAMPSCIAACLSVLAVFLAINIFSVPWFRAYSIGAVLASCLVALGSTQYYSLLYHEEEK